MSYTTNVISRCMFDRRLDSRGQMNRFFSLPLFPIQFKKDTDALNVHNGHYTAELFSNMSL